MDDKKLTAIDQEILRLEREAEYARNRDEAVAILLEVQVLDEFRRACRKV